MIKDELTRAIGAKLKKARKLQEAYLECNFLTDIQAALGAKSATKVNWIESGKQYLTVTDFTWYCKSIQLNDDEINKLFCEIVQMIRSTKN